MSLSRGLHLKLQSLRILAWLGRLACYQKDAALCGVIFTIENIAIRQQFRIKTKYHGCGAPAGISRFKLTNCNKTSPKAHTGVSRQAQAARQMSGLTILIGRMSAALSAGVATGLATRNYATLIPFGG
jgi:hypothetical protein